MKIVVSMDSFKGVMSAREACERVRDGLLSAHPDWDVQLVPMADGGEGTAEAIRAAKEGERVTVRVAGPLPGQMIEADYAWLPREQSAVVEMAAASGITLLQHSQLNPLRTTTRGTGELIRHALDHGAKHIYLAVGGSATNDGGIGAATALGWQFLDKDGESVEPVGGALADIVTIVPPETSLCVPVEVLCDVDNPLTGPQGAAAMYGPQKGATPQMVKQLDEGLRNLAARVRAQLGIEIETVPGAGAAGGMAAGALAFMGARLVPGIETVIEISGLNQLLHDADWILTGEGKFDAQSLRGKVVSGIARAARKCGVQIGVLAGNVQVPESEVETMGIAFARATAPSDWSFEKARPTAKEDLQRTAAELAKGRLSL